MEASAPAYPSLPNELWIRILQSLDADEDLSFLWVTCRHVCTVFKETTESMFREKLLPKLRIDFQLEEFIPPIEDDDRVFSRIPDCGFQFDRLSEDRNTAILQADEDVDYELWHITQKRIRQCLADIDLEIPLYTIQIRRDVNDGPISGFSINQDTLELSCNWRELFSAFYGEEFLYYKFLGEAEAGRELWLADLKAKVDKKEVDPQLVIMKAVQGFADDNEVARKKARRLRIKRQFREFDGAEWDFTRDGDKEAEKNVLKNLEQLREFASFEEWSDEEEEEDGDGDGDGDSEDQSGEEWETEDEEDAWEDEGNPEADD